MPSEGLEHQSEDNRVEVGSFSPDMVPPDVLKDAGPGASPESVSRSTGGRVARLFGWGRKEEKPADDAPLNISLEFSRQNICLQANGKRIGRELVGSSAELHEAREIVEQFSDLIETLRSFGMEETQVAAGKLGNELFSLFGFHSESSTGRDARAADIPLELKGRKLKTMLLGVFETLYAKTVQAGVYSEPFEAAASSMFPREVEVDLVAFRRLFTDMVTALRKKEEALRHEESLQPPSDAEWGDL